VRAILVEAGATDCAYQLLDASRGGFARVDAALLEFLRASEAASGLALEPLYTAKALMALRQRVEAGYFDGGSRLVFVHTGGLQGRAAAMQQYERSCTRAIGAPSES
jgi:1-aminocyclopropane-1-carboxylate deaminase